MTEKKKKAALFYFFRDIGISLALGIIIYLSLLYASPALSNWLMVGKTSIYDLQSLFQLASAVSLAFAIAGPNIRLYLADVEAYSEEASRALFDQERLQFTEWPSKGAATHKNRQDFCYEIQSFMLNIKSNYLRSSGPFAVFYSITALIAFIMLLWSSFIKTDLENTLLIFLLEIMFLLPTLQLVLYPSVARKIRKTARLAIRALFDSESTVQQIEALVENLQSASPLGEAPLTSTNP